MPKGCPSHPAMSPSTKIAASDQAEIKRHILNLYHQFMDEKKNAKIWYDPILKFLREYNPFP
jgi:hypothetical protein